MNNFTKTESLPKTGHVTEVCKEWLVREDGALAYKLQSQEINDFYKGNRFRNAVVREDFPTALHEQIKEKENAEKRVEMYRRKLMEQEEHDKSVAKEIADKLERDLQEQKQRELQESEIMAQQMQEIYVNLPPALPPGSRDIKRPPPRPAKASLLHQGLNEPPRSNGRLHHPSHHNQQQEQLSHRQQQKHRNQPIQLQQEHFSNKDCYVGLSLSSNLADIPTTQQRQTLHQNAPNTNHLLVSDESPSAVQKAINQFVERPKFERNPPVTPNNNLTTSIQQQQLQSRIPHSSSAASSLSTTPTSSSACRRNVFESINLTQTSNLPLSPTQTLLHNALSLPKQAMQSAVEELIEYSDVADSIRQYDISSLTVDAPDSQFSLHQHSASSHTNFNKTTSLSNDNLLSIDHKFQKLSPEKYDQLVGNDGAMFSAAAAERHIQQHADDIELYVDPCDYASLKEIGLPMEEIKEISKKLKQEQKDELLARRLQEMESIDGLSQEERDRMLAIEAQDKELAKMLQDRERAKAKRSKEKARLRKNQQKDSSIQSLCSTTNGLHCGPLLPLPQDCMSSLKNSSSAATNVKLHAQVVPEDHLDLEAYSNPIDVIQSQQRIQNGTLTNGSLTRDIKNFGKHVATHVRDDDIYTLPVDSCRSGQRPASLNIGPEIGRQHNSMTRSENYSLESHDSLNGQDISPRMNYSHSGTFDQSSSPTPPYMPIQGTRRSNSSEDRKKKSKDKCTHQ